MNTTPVVTSLLAAPLQRAGIEQATVLSVGIGHARQEEALLDELARPGAALRRCTVVGMDPDTESLAKAEKRLRDSDAVTKYGLDLDFLAIPRIAEEAAGWQCIAALNGVLVVNSTLAVHHMQDPLPGHDARDEFFQRLRLLDPAVVVLTEFDSDHHDVSLPQRFFNSWSFFGSILRAIEDSAADEAEKDLMTTFFRREVMNIVGARTDAQRFERHEPARTWLERFHRCGYTPVSPEPPSTSSTATTPCSRHPTTSASPTVTAPSAPSSPRSRRADRGIHTVAADEGSAATGKCGCMSGRAAVEPTHGRRAALAWRQDSGSGAARWHGPSARPAVDIRGARAAAPSGGGRAGGRAPGPGSGPPRA
ncbi:GRAS family protein [Streptomyces triculaminicus]|uniref:GRAS family protein n=1 Tax=Streptomyces triculaminicus TaxID=2816232 RepID=UPI00379D5772